MLINIITNSESILKLKAKLHFTWWEKGSSHSNIFPSWHILQDVLVVSDYFHTLCIKGLNTSIAFTPRFKGNAKVNEMKCIF